MLRVLLLVVGLIAWAAGCDTLDRPLAQAWSGHEYLSANQLFQRALTGRVWEYSVRDGAFVADLDDLGARNQETTAGRR